MRRNRNGRRKIFGLYMLLIQRILELENGNKVIPYKDVRNKICKGFSIHRDEVWELLFLLRDLEIIQLIPGHGIRINRNSDIII